MGYLALTSVLSDLREMVIADWQSESQGISEVNDFAH